MGVQLLEMLTVVISTGTLRTVVQGIPILWKVSAMKHEQTGGTTYNSVMKRAYQNS